MASLLDSCARLPGSVPFHFLDYVKISAGASTIQLLDANNKQPWFPFSDEDDLYEVWRRSLAELKECFLPLLVAIPRGAKGDAQMMTAVMMMVPSGAGQDPDVGIHWVHCQ